MKNLKHTILILTLFFIPSFIIGNDDITNNDFKIRIYNNTQSNGSFSFNWVVVATD